MRRIARVATTAIVTLLGLVAIAPAAASAATLYTSPTGGVSGCTEGSPCSLDTALAWAQPGDEIRLAADEYRRTSQLEITTPNLTIAGPPGRYSPLDFRAFLIFEPPATSASNIRVRADGFSLERVSVVGAAGAQVLINSLTNDGMTLARVSIVDTGSQQTVVGQDASIENSVIRQDSGTYGAVGITGAIYGSTITSATADAIVNDDSYHDPTFGDYCDLQILNTIAVGATGNLVTANGASACDPNIDYDYSWIPSSPGFGGGGIVDPGGFVTAGAENLADSPPALTSPFGGTFDLALDSPAVNTGCGGSCGIEDFYGRPRPIGAGNDIGATETILPASISTVALDSVTWNEAELSATVNPNGGATSWNFQIREAGDLNWDTVVGGTTGDGVSPVTVRGTAQPLKPDTSYELRLGGVNTTGVESVSPSITSFTTGPAPPVVSIRIRSAKAKVTRKGVSIRTRVRTSTPGRVNLRAFARTGALRTWCRAAKRVGAAGVHTLTCRLGRKARGRVRRGPLRLTLEAALAANSGLRATSVRNLTIPRRR